METKSLDMEGKIPVMIIGPAGCGKTRYINTNFGSDEYLKLGTTGMAASGLSSSTINSYFCMGLGNINTNISYKNLSDQKIKTINDCKLIIIDECFMLSNNIVNKLDEILKLVCNNNNKFGNKQLVLVGDDKQLLAVKDIYDFNSLKCYKKRLNYDKMSRLTKEYVYVCNIVRNKGLMALYNHLDIFASEPFKDSVNIYFRNKDVDRKNTEEMARIGGDLRLKYKGYPYMSGSRIMISKNIDISRGLFNGKICTIEDNNTLRDKDNTYRISNLTSNCIIPGYAFTIHKVQGSTLDNVNVYIDKRNGGIYNRLLYVAITRVRKSSDCYIEFI